MPLEPPRDRSPYRAICDENSEQLVRDLIKKRGILKARLTKFSNHVKSCKEAKILSSQGCIDLKLRIQGAASLFTEFSNIQSEIETSVFDTNLEDQLTHRDQFEDCYYGALALAESMLTSGVMTNSSASSSNHLNSIKLPTIPMPTFDGS